MQQREPNWDIVEEAEVIEKQEDAAYKPSIKRAETEAIESGNIVPLVGAMKAQDATDVEIVNKVSDVTISGSLKTAMMMPNALMSVGSNIKSNAEAIAEVLLSKATSGDMAAIREVLNRTEGKVANRTERMSASLNVRGDANSLSSLMARIDSNKKEGE